MSQFDAAEAGPSTATLSDPAPAAVPPSEDGDGELQQEQQQQKSPDGRPDGPPNPTPPQIGAGEDRDASEEVNNPTEEADEDMEQDEFSAAGLSQRDLEDALEAERTLEQERKDREFAESMELAIRMQNGEAYENADDLEEARALQRRYDEEVMSESDPGEGPSSAAASGVKQNDRSEKAGTALEASLEKDRDEQVEEQDTEDAQAESNTQEMAMDSESDPNMDQEANTEVDNQPEPVQGPSGAQNSFESQTDQKKSKKCKKLPNRKVVVCNQCNPRAVFYEELNSRVVVDHMMSTNHTEVDEVHIGDVLEECSVKIPEKEHKGLRSKNL